MRPPIGMIVLLFFSISIANVRATHPPTWSAPSSNTPLRRMIVDPSTGNIYVAGKDAIFQFTSSPLGTSHIAKTGPLNDNKGCFPRDWFSAQSCFDNNFPTKIQSNFNQILLLNGSGDSILSCGNLEAGTCNLRSASNISKISISDEEMYKAGGFPAVEMIIVTRDDVSNSAGVISSDYLGRPALFLVTHSTGLSSVKPSEISVRGMSSHDLLQPLLPNFQLDFPFDIISGFESGEFVYFVAVDSTSTAQDPSVGTLIARICRNDKGMAADDTLYGYLEAYIECKGSSGKTYKYLQSMYVGEVGSLLAQNIGNSTVLMGAFNEKIDGTGASALCLISLAQIDSRYKQALENCRNGISGFRGFARDSTPNPCTNALKTLWDGTGCSPSVVDINLEIPSTNPIVSNAFYEIAASPSAALTAVAFTDVNVRDTVAFAGKGDGTLDKINVLASTSSQLIGTPPTGTSSKIISLEWSSDQSSIYALSEYNLTKIPAQECDTRTMCSSCLTPLDPYCGHCVLENKCTLSDTSVCQAASNPVRWIQNASDCINLVSISPKQASVAGTIQVRVNIENVPNVGAYSCVFGTGPETVATRITVVGQEGFTCPTPTLTSGLQGQHEVQNPISIRSATTSDIIATSSDKFQLYDCSSYSDCFECTDSTLPCGWCTFSNRCTSSSGQCRSPMNWLQGPSDSCPQLIQGTYNWPVGITAWDFSIAGKNFPQPSQGDKYQCQVRVPGQLDVNVDATWISSTNVSCSATAYMYTDSKPTKEATLEVTWRGKVLENKDSTQLNLYKCDEMAVSCSDCLASERKYECGWCENKCSVRAGCATIFTTTAGSCPEPDIREVFPINGPVEGGTNVTIKGADIGIAISDINGVTVAGRTCSFTADTYTPGRSIVCTTSPVADSSPFSPKTGPVVVQVNGRDYQFSQDFNYLVSSVSSFEPRLGPKAGGTRIEIKGENLHIGSMMSIRINGVVCALGSRTLSAVDCTLGASPMARSGLLSLNIDNAELQDPSSSRFQFTPNPTVTGIKPSTGLAKGGIELTVEGTNLNSIQAPAVLFSRDDSPSYRADCRKPTRANSTICFQPNVPADSLGSTWNVSFEMDNVSPENLTLLNTFTIIPEKDFSISGNVIDVTVGVPITISGTHLLRLKDLQDAIEIKFGSVAICNISDIADTAITCTPFALSDEPVGKDLPIMISIGKYNTTGGRATISESAGSVPVGLIAGIVGGVAAIAAVIIILVVYFSHMGRVQNKKYVSSLLIQMDRMEADMAKECKQGFAELQTDLDVIYEDAASLTTYVPSLKFRDFAFRVFFPNTADHDVLYPLQDRLNNMEPAAAKRLVMAMDMFRGLLGNKTFLAKMIHTMEGERSFTMRDRGEVASLLMVIYQNQMDYATEILKMLLSDLIRSGVGRSQPKLLLRRTETVAEKLLTNWLSVCLHQYLEEVAGSPLYTLYLAVKNQIDKGPVDAITGESRYALSEEKLLRQQIEYKERRCSVLVEGQVTPVHVRLLDVDTISQAKEKCLDAVYKTTGVSSRPALHEVDLSVVSQSESSSRSSRNVLRLRDEDNSTRVESGWKRVNTLAHYNITDGTTLTLVPRDDVSKNGKVVDHTQMIVASPTQSIATLDDDSGPRVWHLIKQVDTTTREHQKMVSEIYLTRMLSTKRIVQKFVDDVFDSMYAVAKVPFALKYLYDFLDSQAEMLNISDPDVLHTWKNNSVPLRFWMNVIKNPEFVFDVHKSVSVDSFLNIVASTFMDGCSVSEHKLSKESPSSKLLYNKEVQQYKQRVQRYYAEIKDQRKLTEADMKREMARISHLHGNEFHRDTALYQLSMYVLKYHSQLSNELLMDANLSKSLYKLLEALRE